MTVRTSKVSHWQIGGLSSIKPIIIRHFPRQGDSQHVCSFHRETGWITVDSHDYAYFSGCPRLTFLFLSPSCCESLGWGVNHTGFPSPFSTIPCVLHREPRVLHVVLDDVNQSLSLSSSTLLFLNICLQDSLSTPDIPISKFINSRHPPRRPRRAKSLLRVLFLVRVCSWTDACMSASLRLDVGPFFETHANPTQGSCYPTQLNPSSTLGN